MKLKKPSRRVMKTLSLLVVLSLAVLLLLRLWLRRERAVLEETRTVAAAEEAYNDTLKEELDMTESGG